MNARHIRAAVLAVLLVGATLAMGAAFVGGAAAQEGEELENVTVTTTNDTQSIYTDVNFSANATVTVELYNTSGTVVQNTTLDGDNSTESVEWSVSEVGDYRVVVTGNSSDVSNIEIGYLEESAVVVTDDSNGSPGFGALVALIALATAAVAASRGR